MRVLQPGFAAHIAGGATTLATCWRIERGDGNVLGFTDHDVLLNFDGVDYQPALGLDGTDEVSKLGAQIDTSEIVGIVHSDAIGEDDILLGRYDGAVVEMWRVNWRNVEERQRLRRDTIGEIRREDGVFTAELRSAQHALNVPKGRLYEPLCGARLGDVKCGIDLDIAAYKAAIDIVRVVDRFNLVVDGIGGFDAKWFELGQAVWSSGQRAGVSDLVVGQRPAEDGVQLTFERPVGDWVVAGDAAALYAGCDRRFSTCGAKFDNQLNFRGFPHIPGNDFILRYPKAGSDLSGQALVK